MYKLLFLLLFVCGCDGNKDIVATPQTLAPKMPEKAKNFKNVGNHWWTFECEVMGKERKFLIRAWKISGGINVDKFVVLE